MHHFFAFHGIKGYANASQYYVYTYIASLSLYTPICNILVKF
jgi:hypothetical protein